MSERHICESVSVTAIHDHDIDALFASFLHDQTGQDIARLGGARVAIENLLRMHGWSEPKELLAHALADEHIRQQLINVLTVTETWFFRDHAPFEQLDEELRTRRGRTDKVQMLCWPCATGEEAYSMAAVAHANGWDAHNCRIEAHDINDESLGTARAGHYALRAFRSVADDRWREGLLQQDDRVVVAPILQQMVDFSPGNICNAYAVCEGRRYDVIFCRNLLIYLSESLQRDVIDQLTLLLAPGGVLFVGHAEAGLIKRSDLTALARASVFGFRRNVVSEATVPSKVTIAARDRTSERSARGKLPETARRERVESPATLAELRSLADAGRLNEARQRCDALLSVAQDDAEVSYVCALVAQAQGRTEAAVTLLDGILNTQPHHAAALLLMAAHHEAKGDREKARELRQRAAQSRPWTREGA